MPLTRRHRFRSALVVLFSMLFMQLAVAGYVCPVEAEPAAGNIAAMQDVQAAGEAMSDCGQAMAEEPASAHLCMAHCQVENQSLDKHELPAFQAALPDPILAIVVYSTAPSGLGDGFLQPVSLTRATAPPISIRNCCFRT